MPTRRGLIAGLALTIPALAQEPWPGSRPVEIIVPYPPAGGIDVMARLIGQLLPAHLPGLKIVVQNRVGAGGQTGNEAIFAARPDGHTLGAIATLSFSSIPLDRQARWDLARFTYIAQVVDDPGAFWVRADSPLKTLADLKAAAAKGAEAVSVGSAAGIGSDDHQLLLAFEEATGVRALHSPYNGTAIAIRDLLGGQIDVASYNLSEGIALFRDGRTRCLGAAAPERWSAMPDVPTFREQGIDVIGGSARGFVGPPDMPAAITGSLVAAFRALLASPEFAAEAARLNLPLRPLLGDAFRAATLQEAEAVRELFRKRPWSTR